ncbi:ABC transporter substrate-binding protein [Pollutimonas subterranea]|uniref:ABC transporter substrate-binding protein n=1 Tax=Pollutimonas subterranea TaxID=2045210 RepID=A0A2N4U257_9BURK|nr:TRAP transporter substrate-binding protein [Pollutimonas subterranea]PLC49100.1 ABC transporter substrate-binding protein [Pollutimonas subterranea]
MKLKRIVATAVLSAVAGLVVAGNTYAQEFKARNIRFGHGMADNHPAGLAAKAFSAEVLKETGGKTKISVIANQALGPDPQMLGALQGGVQEFYTGSVLAMLGQVKELGFQDVPFLFESEAEAHVVFDGAVGDYLNNKLSAVGIHVLGWWENGFRHITNSRRPVNTLADIEGLKLRTQPNPLTLDAFKALGANASPLAWSELFVALETRAFDGQENPIVLMNTQRFYEVQKYMTLSGHVYSPLVFAVSKKFWDGLSSEEQAIMTAAAKKVTAYQRDLTASEVDVALQNMEKNGMQVTRFSDADLQKIRDLVPPAIAPHLEKIGPEFMTLLRNEIATARANKKS